MKDDGKVSLFFIILFVVVLVIVSSTKDNRIKSLEAECESLQEQCDSLQERVSSFYISSGRVGAAYDSTIDNLSSVEDDIATVYCFFEKENDITFSEAYDSFMRINSVYSSIIH